jgi:hypothetical protein
MWLGVDFVKPQVYNNNIITGLQQGVTNKKNNNNLLLLNPREEEIGSLHTNKN